MSLKQRLATWFAKALSEGQMIHPSSPIIWFDLDSARPELEDLEREVGDGTSSDVLMTPIRWLQRAMMEAPLVELDRDGEPTDGNLQKLLDEPNPYYSLEHLIAGTVLSLSMDGNAYWILVENGNGRLSEIWWAPHGMMEPVAGKRSFDENGNEIAAPFISHYRYTPGGGSEKLSVDSVVHFREGMDPANPRLGLSPLKGLLREIWTDNEIGNFVSAMLRNGGVPGLIISPRDKDFTLERKEAAAAEAKIETKTTRHNRGRVIALSGPVAVEQFGYSPQQMDLSPLRNVSEERVTAALGVPAAVVGFGTGLEQTKVGATMEAMIKLAWYNGVIPLQRIIAGEVTRKLAPMVKAEQAAFDVQQVEALRENQDSRSRRVTEQFRASLITRAEAKVELGYETDPSDEVYAVPISTVFVPAGQRMEATNGNGSDPEQRARGFDAFMKRHSLTEERLIDERPHAEPPEQVLAFVRRMDRIRRRAAGIFESLIEPVFRRLGEQAARAAREVLPEESGRSDTGESKQGGEEEIIARTILGEIAIGVAAEELSAAYTEAYLQIAGEVAEAMSATLGIEISLPDPTQLSVLQQGGTRSGLVELETQTREAIFRGLEEGRAQGLAGENLARYISERVEAGPWSSAAIRAEVIARTEGAYAANVSSLAMGREIGAEQAMVHDNRTGFGDDICPAMDGLVVSLSEAEALAAAEHPNGTRGFTPLPALLVEEMGL